MTTNAVPAAPMGSLFGGGLFGQGSSTSTTQPAASSTTTPSGELLALCINVHVGLNTQGGLFGAKAPAANELEKKDGEKKDAPAGTENLHIRSILSNFTAHSNSKLQLIRKTR